jgi:hypothetical protein
MVLLSYFCAFGAAYGSDKFTLQNVSTDMENRSKILDFENLDIGIRLGYRSNWGVSESEILNNVIFSLLLEHAEV